MAERTIRAVITGSSIGAVKAFEETAAAAEGAGKRASGAMQTGTAKIGGSFSSMGSKVTTILGPLAAIGIGGFATAAMGHFEDVGHAAFEMSEKFGLTTGQAGLWAGVASQLGVPLDSVSTGMKLLSKNMEAAHLSLEQGKQIPAQLGQPLKDLGVQLLDSHGQLRDVNSVLMDVSDKFEQMPDGPDKAALSLKLFGRSGTDMIPILNQGSDGFADLAKKATDAGDVLGGSQVDAAQKAYLAHQQLAAAVHGVENALGQALVPALTTVAPYLTQFSGWFATDGMHHLQGFTDEVKNDLIPPVIAVGKEVLPPVIDAFKFLADHTTLVEGLLAVIAARFVAIKAANAASEVTQFANAFSVMAGQEGKIKALLAALGMGGSSGLSGAVRGLKTEVTGAEGLSSGLMGMGSSAVIATGGVAALAIAAIGLGTDAGGVRTSIKNAIWGEDQRQAYQEATKSISGLADQMATDLVAGGKKGQDAVIKSLQDIADAAKRTNDFEGAAQVVRMANDAQFTAAVKSGSVSAMNALFDASKQNGDEFAGLAVMANSSAQQIAAGYMSASQVTAADWQTTANQMASLMTDLAAHGGVTTQKMITDYNTAVANITAATQRATTTSNTEWDQAAASFKADAEAQGITDQKQVDAYVARHMDMYRQINPDAAKAHDLIVAEAAALGETNAAITTYGQNAVAQMLGIKTKGLDPNSKAYKDIINLIQQAQGQTTLWAEAAAKVAAALSSLDMGKVIGAGITAGAAGVGASGHAAGGPVAAGEWSWVGEEGPELVHFGRSGTVIPHGASTGGGGDTYHVTNNYTVNGATDPQAVVNALRLYMQRNGSVPITVRT